MVLLSATSLRRQVGVMAFNLQRHGPVASSFSTALRAKGKVAPRNLRDGCPCFTACV